MSKSVRKTARRAAALALKRKPEPERKEVVEPPVVQPVVPKQPLPPIGQNLELTEAEKAQVAQLRDSYRSLKLALADATLRLMQAQDNQINYRSAMSKVESQLDVFSGEILRGRGFDPTKPAESGQWRFDIANATMTRTA